MTDVTGNDPIDRWNTQYVCTAGPLSPVIVLPTPKMWKKNLQIITKTSKKVETIQNVVKTLQIVEKHMSQ